MIYMTLMLVLNAAFIIIFFKELKVSTFDPEFATLAGFSSTLLYYFLMTLTSFTAVSALNAVVGYYLSISLNVSILGLVATMTGLTTLLTVLFNHQGVVTSIYKRYKNRKEFHLDMMIIHIGNHHELEDKLKN